MKFSLGVFRPAALVGAPKGRRIFAFFEKTFRVQKSKSRRAHRPCLTFADRESMQVVKERPAAQERTAGLSAT
jgi:hypothetical protein